MTLQDDIRPSPATAREIAEHKWFFWLAGGAATLAGVLAIVVPQLGTLAVEVMLGAIFLVSGLIGCVTAFRGRKTREIAAGLGMGVLATATGALLLLFPFEGILAVTLTLAAFFLVAGVFKGYAAYKLRPAKGWGWMAVGAALSLTLGGLIYSGFPGNAAWVLGLIAGVELIFYGATLFAIYAAARQVLEQQRHHRHDRAEGSANTHADHRNDAAVGQAG